MTSCWEWRSTVDPDPVSHEAITVNRNVHLQHSVLNWDSGNVLRIRNSGTLSLYTMLFWYLPCSAWVRLSRRGQNLLRPARRGLKTEATVKLQEFGGRVAWPDLIWLVAKLFKKCAEEKYEMGCQNGAIRENRKRTERIPPTGRGLTRAGWAVSEGLVGANPYFLLSSLC